MQKPDNWPAFHAEKRSIESLKPYPKNARIHSAEQIKQIAASMAEWGWTNPVLIDEAGGIIAGHGRVDAAKTLGITEVPVIVARGWTKEQKQAYIIADNQLTLNAGWDLDILRGELGDLASVFDVGLLGFPDDFLFGLMADRGGLTDPDEAPPLGVNAVSRTGDLWLCGGHRVMCGDSLDIDQVMKLTGGAIPDVANCDPPYGIGIVKHAGASDGGAKPFGSIGGKRLATDPKHISNFGKVGGGKPHPFAGKKNGREHGRSKKAIIQLGIYAQIIGDDTTDTAVASYAMLMELEVPAIVLWGGNYFADRLPASRCWLVWDKENTGTFADAELAWTNQDAIVRVLRHQWSGLIKASERGERRVHPTQKPVALAEWVIETIAPKAKTAIDLFLGSGSTLIACERKGIACFGMELSPQYCDVTVKRWQAFTGKTATLEGDGRTFDDMGDERYDADADARDSYYEAIEAKRTAAE